MIINSSFILLYEEQSPRTAVVAIVFHWHVNECWTLWSYMYNLYNLNINEPNTVDHWQKFDTNKPLTVPEIAMGIGISNIGVKANIKYFLHRKIRLSTDVVFTCVGSSWACPGGCWSWASSSGRLLYPLSRPSSAILLFNLRSNQTKM